MLVVACLLVASVLSGRLFARGLVVSSAAATETALAALRPAVNTPIPILPTAASSGAIYPTMAIDPPTPVAQAQPPASNPQPTARPTSPAQQTGGASLPPRLGPASTNPTTHSALWCRLPAALPQSWCAGTGRWQRDI
jgi:hypothetical protein